MDHQKEHNGWLTLQEHWGFLGMGLVTVLVLLIMTHFSLPMHKSVKAIESDDIYGDFSSDTNSVYWNVLSEPNTNRIQFVLMLPATMTIGSGSTNYTAYDYDYCDLQIRSNHHHWRIESDVDWKLGAQTLQLQDLTANTTETLPLGNARFWQLDGEGQAKQVETIDSNTMANIFSHVKAYQTNLAGAQANAD